MIRIAVGSLVVALLVAATPPLAEAKTLYVANNGFDSTTCGAKNDPCRSIGNTIVIASAGDRIVVGPGHYGDLNGDGSLGSAPGEEAYIPACGCMIQIDKPLTLESSHGAAATKLVATFPPATTTVVVAAGVHGVVFGKKKKGFTLIGTDDALDIYWGTSGVKVEGNWIRDGGGTGIFTQGSNHTFAYNIVSGNGEGFDVIGSGHTISHNLISNNHVFGIETGGSGHTISHNLIIGNGTEGVGIFGAGNKITHNVASGNRSGFDLEANGLTVTHNVAAANEREGFFATGSNIEIRSNAALGNGGVGIWIGYGDITVTKNSLFGNDAGGVNCGLRNDSTAAISAPKNFWGAPTGPGVDPADGVCGDPIAVAPVATKEIKVKPSAGP